jgi:hypothetical protein
MFKSFCKLKCDLKKINQMFKSFFVKIGGLKKSKKPIKRHLTKKWQVKNLFVKINKKPVFFDK